MILGGAMPLNPTHFLDRAARNFAERTAVIDDDQDLDEDIWWDPARGGTGAGYNINAILPIQPAPLVGMQGWYDTVCSVRKV